MAKTQAERAAEYRARKRDEKRDVTASVTASVTDLPALPGDEVIACNADVGWPDVLAMSKDHIDYVYRTWQAAGDSILLRLRRAAGYHRRAA